MRAGGDDASQGSSHLSPPAKKARAVAEPLTGWDEKPKPRRQPRADPSQQAESPPEDRMEVVRDSDGEPVDPEHLDALTLSSE